MRMASVGPLGRPAGPLREGGGGKIPAPPGRVKDTGSPRPARLSAFSLESWHDVLREAAEEPTVERRAQREDDLGGPRVGVRAYALLDGGGAVGENRLRHLLLHQGACPEPH